MPRLKISTLGDPAGPGPPPAANAPPNTPGPLIRSASNAGGFAAIRHDSKIGRKKQVFKIHLGPGLGWCLGCNSGTRLYSPRLPSGVLWTARGDTSELVRHALSTRAWVSQDPVEQTSPSDISATPQHRSMLGKRRFSFAQPERAFAELHQAPLNAVPGTLSACAKQTRGHCRRVACTKTLARASGAAARLWDLQRRRAPPERLSSRLPTKSISHLDRGRTRAGDWAVYAGVGWNQGRAVDEDGAVLGSTAALRRRASFPTGHAEVGWNHQPERLSGWCGLAKDGHGRRTAATSTRRQTVSGTVCPASVRTK
ncbi:hypothetical protein V8D89_008981, partial [Ganoderma adspersum]